MSSSAVRSYIAGELVRNTSPAHYSNRFFSKNTSSGKMFKIILSEQSSSTNRIICLRPVFHSEATTSNKIDGLAVRGLINRILKFEELKENWDGYNGAIPDGLVIIEAIELVKKFPTYSLPDRVGISGDGKFCYFIECNNKKFYGDEIQISEGISSEVLSIPISE